MKILGISEGFHDAAICLLHDDKIHYASSSERYSGIKNDKWIHKNQLPTTRMNKPDVVSYYEKPFLKNLRRWYAGQRWQKPRLKYDVNFGHHESHAAAGYYTAPFDDCNVLVIDAIGEWDTISIWEGKDNKLKKGCAFSEETSFRWKNLLFLINKSDSPRNFMHMFKF